MNEAEFQRQVIQLARLRGWAVVHFRPARTARGWRTAVQGDGAGFPDLVMVRQSRLIFAELKSARGRLTPEQRAWLEALQGCSGIEVELWTPNDWPEIEKALA